MVHFAKTQRMDLQMDWYRLTVAEDDVGADMVPSLLASYAVDVAVASAVDVAAASAVAETSWPSAH